MIRILLADDHAIVRAGYRRLLEAESDMTVVAEADSADAAYEALRTAEVDIVIMDISMPGKSGLDALRRIRARWVSLRVLVVTMHDSASLATQAVRSGANGFVTKSSSPDFVIAAVRGVTAGRLMLSPDVANSLALQQFDAGGDALTRLSPREFEVFRLLVGGRSIEAVADAMSISVKTVSNYHTIIKQKLAATSDFDLARIALQAGMLIEAHVASSKV